VNIAEDTELNVADGSLLELTGGLTSGATSVALTKTGGGELRIGGPQQHDGTIFTITDGTVVLNSNMGAPAAAAPPAAGKLAATSTPANATSGVHVTGNTRGTNSLLTINADQDIQEFGISFEDASSQGVDLHSTATEFHSLRLYAFDQLTLRNRMAAAIAHAKTTPGDGLFDSGLHAGAAIGYGFFDDANGDGFMLIRPTRIGDLNLDGIVSISDFIDLASNFNAPGFWQQGDLNGDGVVTISDFIDLASNFNTAYAGEVFPISPEDQAALTAFAAAHGVSLVPEPASLSILFLGACLLPRRRRKI
jgi:hypothetical protein